MKTSYVLDFEDVMIDVTSRFKKIDTNQYCTTGSTPIVDQSANDFCGYTDIQPEVSSIFPPYIIFGDHTRRFKFVEKDFVLGADGTKVLKTKIDADHKYLFHFFKSIKLAEAGYSRHYKFLKRTKIFVPPIAEQQRIAAFLDTADHILRLRESAIAKLDQLAQSVFLNELRACDSSSFQLAEVAEMYQPKTISANELIENGEYVVYGANGVIGRYDKFNHADSEVLVTCRGATCGTVNRSQPLAWITGNAMVVKPLNNIVTKEFLHYYFKFVADFSSVITGAAQPQITRQTLSRLMIVIPKLKNQNEITNIVREIYKKHELMNFSKNKLQELTRALQHQSFAVN